MQEYHTNRKDLSFYRLPGGLKGMAGGGRTGIRLHRPWQKMWSGQDREQCPFCHFSEEDGVMSSLQGWHIKTNKFPVYDINRIIFPESCWSNSDLYELGGSFQIETALKIARQEMASHPDIPLVVSVNVGFLAGQNYPHIHYHLQSVFGIKHNSRIPTELGKFYEDRPDFVLFNDGGMTVGVGGARSGQCFIFPRGRKSTKDDILPELARVLHRLVSLCNKKFLSTQGLPPDFTVAFYFENDFSYGLYTPILSNWGGTEYLSLHEGGDILLRWPHEVTAAYLNGR